MVNLYDIAIRELSRIYNERQLVITVEKTVDNFGNTRNRTQRNSFNKMPLKNIDKYFTSKPIYESLEEFIEILEILRDLDIIFIELIDEYEDSYKYEHTYKDIKKRLLIVIDRNYIDNTKEILSKAINDLFSVKYQRKNLSSIYFYFYNKIFAYISEYYSDLLDVLADFYIRENCIGISVSESAKDYISKSIEDKKNQRYDITEFMKIGDNFTFLSYAFKDKLMSFLLFLEARSNKIVLFVDWMYSKNYSNRTVELEANLNYFLNVSKQILFLRSINSELNTSVTVRGLFSENKKMVRQWCSWEIGNFYKCSSLSETEYKKFQYILHENIPKNMVNKNKRIEENNLLGDFIVINSLLEM